MDQKSFAKAMLLLRQEALIERLREWRSPDEIPALDRQLTDLAKQIAWGGLECAAMAPQLSG